MKKRVSTPFIQLCDVLLIRIMCVCVLQLRTSSVRACVLCADESHYLCCAQCLSEEHMQNNLSLLSFLVLSSPSNFSLLPSLSSLSFIISFFHLTFTFFLSFLFPTPFLLRALSFSLIYLLPISCNIISSQITQHCLTVLRCTVLCEHLNEALLTRFLNLIETMRLTKQHILR